MEYTTTNYQVCNPTIVNPASLIIVGPSNVGKTFFVIKEIVQKRDIIFREPIKTCLYFIQTGERQDLLQNAGRVDPKFHIIKLTDEIEKIIKEKQKKNEHILLIFDDILLDSKNFISQALSLATEGKDKGHVLVIDNSFNTPSFYRVRNFLVYPSYPDKNMIFVAQ